MNLKLGWADRPFQRLVILRLENFMGYYTRYELSVINGDNNLITELREFSEDANYAINDNGESEDSCKWYKCQEDLKKFSSMHPSTLFKLSGEGEESGDIWNAYFKDGKMQMCKAKIVFDEFNAELLK